MLNQNGKLVNPEIRVENCAICNADCIICAHGRMVRPKGIMPTDFFEKVVIQAKDMGADLISPFGFGEPLLDKELPDKIQICTDLGLKTFITTNGSLCNHDNVTALLNAGLSHLRISVHALNKEDYEVVQKGLNWETTFENIFNTFEIKNTYYPDKKVSLTVIPMNGETVDEIRDFWEPHADWLEIWRPHNWATVKRYRNKTINRKKTCHRPERGPLQLQWDGMVIPCCFLTNAELVLGDAHEQSLEEILKGNKYEELREKHREGDLKGLPCEDCDQLNIETEDVLLYSSRDKERKVGKTSSNKFNLEEL